MGACLHPPAALGVLNAHGAVIREQDPRSLCVRQDPEIGAPARGVQIGAGCRPAASAFHLALIEAHTFLPRAVEIAVARNARGDEGLDDRIADRVAERNVASVQRATRGMPFVVQIDLVLQSEEIGQHFVEVPAGRTCSGPRVVVGMLTADVDEPVDGRGAAEHAAAGQSVAAPTGPGVGLTEVARRASGDTSPCRSRSACRRARSRASPRPRAGGRAGRGARKDGWRGRSLRSRRRRRCNRRVPSLSSPWSGRVYDVPCRIERWIGVHDERREGPLPD